MIEVRAFRPGDAPALFTLFRDTVRRVNIRDYTEEQVRAWAPDAVDLDAWAARFAGRYVAVAERAGEIAGFVDLEEDGHVDRFYVSADHQGCGVGRALMDAVLAETNRAGHRRLFTEASVTARPFFERFGFEVVAPQTVTLHGVEFVNYRMERSVGRPADGEVR